MANGKVVDFWKWKEGRTKGRIFDIEELEKRINKVLQNMVGSGELSNFKYYPLLSITNSDTSSFSVARIAGGSIVFRSFEADIFRKNKPPRRSFYPLLRFPPDAKEEDIRRAVLSLFIGAERRQR